MIVVSHSIKTVILHAKSLSLDICINNNNGDGDDNDNNNKGNVLKMVSSVIKLEIIYSVDVEEQWLIPVTMMWLTMWFVFINLHLICIFICSSYHCWECQLFCE